MIKSSEVCVLSGLPFQIAQVRYRKALLLYLLYHLSKWLVQCFTLYDTETRIFSSFNQIEKIAWSCCIEHYQHCNAYWLYLSPEASLHPPSYLNHQNVVALAHPYLKFFIYSSASASQIIIITLVMHTGCTFHQELHCIRHHISIIKIWSPWPIRTSSSFPLQLLKS